MFASMHTFLLHACPFSGFIPCISHALPACNQTIHKSCFPCPGTNMFTYMKFGLPRVLPPGIGETSSEFNSSDEEVAGRSRAAGQGRTRLRGARSEDFLDRVGDGQDR